MPFFSRSIFQEIKHKCVSQTTIFNADKSIAISDRLPFSNYIYISRKQFSYHKHWTTSTTKKSPTKKIICYCFFVQMRINILCLFFKCCCSSHLPDVVIKSRATKTLSTFAPFSNTKIRKMPINLLNWKRGGNALGWLLLVYAGRRTYCGVECNKLIARIASRLCVVSWRRIDDTFCVFFCRISVAIADVFAVGLCLWGGENG